MIKEARSAEQSVHAIARGIIDREVRARKVSFKGWKSESSISSLFDELKKITPGKAERRYSYSNGAAIKPVVDILRDMEGFLEQYSGINSQGSQKVELEKGKDYVLSKNGLELNLEVTIPETVLEEEGFLRESRWKKIISKKLPGLTPESDQSVMPQEKYLLIFTRLYGSNAVLISKESEESISIVRFPFGKVAIGDKECPGYEYEISLMTDHGFLPGQTPTILYTEVINSD
jgi:hypothetical protein